MISRNEGNEPSSVGAGRPTLMRQTTTTMMDYIRLKIANWVLPKNTGSIEPTAFKTATLDPYDDPMKRGIVGFEIRGIQMKFSFEPEDVGWLAGATEELAQHLEEDGWDCPRETDR